MADLSTLSDEHLQAIADGKMDTLPDDVLRQFAGEPEAAPAQQTAPEIPRPDATTGPTRGMDPFAYQGAVMASPQGKQVMGQVGQTVKNLGLEGGGATLGQTVGAFGGPFDGVTVPAGGFIGGFLGNTAAQLTTPGKKFSFGEATGAGVAGAVPGGSLVKAGGKELLKQGGKMALANVAAQNAQSLVDTGKPASLKQDLVSAGAGFVSAPISKFLDRGAAAEAARVRAAQDSVRRETLNAGRGLGLVVPPSVVAPTAANNTLNSIAGKAATAQEASILNQPKINAAVRAEIGLPIDAPLSPIALNTARVGPNLAYGRVAQSGPAAASLLDSFKQATAEAKQLYATYRTMPIKDPALLAQAKAAEVQADVFKGGLSKILHPDLMSEFNQARTQLAKIGMAERATRLADGNIDASVLGDAYEAGEKLTGNLAKIGRFQSAFGKYVQEQAKVPPSGVDYLKAFTKIGAGGGLGYAAGGVPGALAGATAMQASEKGARSLILSRPYQRAFANPNYGSVTAPDFEAAMAQYAAMTQGRTNN